MKTSNFPVLITIVGFVYLTAIFFGILNYLNKYDLCFIKDILSYNIYVILIVIPLSYLIGLTVHLIINQISIPWLLKRKTIKKIRMSVLKKFNSSNEFIEYKIEDDFYLQQYANQNLYIKIQTGIGIFYAIRILSFGFISLGFSLLYWFHPYNYRWGIFGLCLFLSIISFFIYMNSRKADDTKNKAVKFLKDENKTKLNN